MGTKTRTIAIMVVCALLGAVALSACGGDDETTSSSTSATAPGSGSGSGSTDTGSGGDNGGSSGSDDTGGDSTGGDTASSDAGGDSAKRETGLEDGERSKAFVTPGGDNSIQEYGSEGDADERTDALVVIKAVNSASETGQWEEVCAKYLSAKNLEQFKIVAEKIPKFKGASCTEILSGLSPGGKGISNPTRPKEGVASVRKDDENAFAIYVGVDGAAYAWPMAVEDGALKATSLAPTPLSPGT